jgi:phosphatidylglycerophosphatase A
VTTGGATRRIRELECRWRDPEVLLLAGFGSGYAPRAPGTFGSLVALAIWWLLLAPLPWPLQLAVIVATFGLGIWLTRRVSARHGVGDDPAIVLDEFVGLWLALLGAPATLTAAVAGFLLFRLFDIWKVGPVGYADRHVHGALGVMLDDLLAGALAFCVLQVALLMLRSA